MRDESSLLNSPSDSGVDPTQPESETLENSTELNPVDVLAEEFTRRLRDGETPSIEEYTQRLPAQAANIRDMFQSIAMVERIGKQGRAERKHDRKTNVLGAARKELGDFLIVSEIGRGGMGVVYEAIQQSLNRRVALKVAGVDASLSPRQLQRFRREAESAAKLHHTNIVPIYGTGEDDGLSFYAMQLIDGIPLSNVIHYLAKQYPSKETTDSPSGTDSPSQCSEANKGHTFNSGVDNSGVLASKNTGNSEQPSATDVSLSFQTEASFDMPASLTLIMNQAQGDSTASRLRPSSPSAKSNQLAEQAAQQEGNWFRAAARLTADVAEALHYAHQHKVLHRDIKPSNLMIDGDGTIWITDFGLARQEDHGSLTNTGDIVGTLRYMAPEQFNGQVDGRSDVCSLGLTFWEMLTLRPAFQEQGHGELIKMKSEASPVHPRSVRSDIPRDLDTIATKACAIDPKHRYQTAIELANDLERFLADRPIHARRATRPERLWRWARRNRAVASLSTASGVLLISLAVVLAMMNLRITSALQIAEAERSNARKSLAFRSSALQQVDIQREKSDNSVRRAELNLQLAVEAFDKIMQNITARGRAESLIGEIPDARLLSPEAIVTPADAELLNLLLPFFERFAVENNTDLTEESAVAFKRAGSILRQLGRFTEAERAFTKAYGLYAKLADESPDDVSNLIEQARLLNEMALTASRQSKTEDATQLYQEARELLEHPPLLESKIVRFELARTLNLYTSMGARTGSNDMFDFRSSPYSDPLNQASLFFREDPEIASRRRAENLAANARAREILDELLAEQPNNMEYRLAFVRSLRDQARLARQSQNNETADRALNDAIGRLEGLANDLPDSPVFKYELADTLCTSLPSQSETEAQRIQQAIQICAGLVGTWPNVPQYRALLGNALSRVAQAESKADQETAARITFTKSLAVYRRLVTEFPSVALYVIKLGQTCEQLAQLEKQAGNADAARKLVDEALNALTNWARNAENTTTVQYLIDRLSTMQ